ncbi:hypothetical protein [Natronococcus pandeyae]|nr:hypothetical protein [Natronococcus pandeyae]
MANGNWQTDPSPPEDDEQEASSADDESKNGKRELESEIAEVVANAYSKERTTTPLDTNEVFKVISTKMRLGLKYDEDALSDAPRTDGGAVAADGETYQFRVKRFLGGRPAETLTGTAYKVDGSWVVDIDEKPGVLDRIRSLIPN